MRGDRTVQRHRIVWQAAAALLAYPEPHFVDLLERVRRAVSGLPPRLREPLASAIDVLAASNSVCEHYVETFDLHRGRTLLLTYWTHGDTRNRGAAMLEFAAAYRRAGVTPPRDELPDHLAVVLEFAAGVDPTSGSLLLQRHRNVLVTLRDALAQMPSPYADVIEAVVRTVRPDPGDVEPVTTPAVESVGIEPYTAFVSADQLAHSLRTQAATR